MARPTTSPLHPFPTARESASSADRADQVDAYLDELVAGMQAPAANAAVDAAVDELARLGGAAMNARRRR
jgi:hypothetical protein